MTYDDSKFNITDNNSLIKSKLDNRRSTLNYASTSCFPIHFSHIKRKSCYNDDNNIQINTYNQQNNIDQKLINQSIFYHSLSFQKINKINNSIDNDKLIKKNPLTVIPSIKNNYYNDNDNDEKDNRKEDDSMNFMKFNSINLNKQNQLQHDNYDVQTIHSLNIPNRTKLQQNVNNDNELSMRIRRVSMRLLQNKHDNTVQLYNQDYESNESNVIKLKNSGSSTFPYKKNQSNDRMELINTIQDNNNNHLDIPLNRMINTTEKNSIILTDDNLNKQNELLHNYDNKSNNLLNKHTLFCNQFKRERRFTDKLSKGIGYHLGRRRRLLENRRRMADFALAFSIFEYTKDWRICVTKLRIIQIITELLICSIHPFPGIDLFFDHSFPVINYINYKRNHTIQQLSDHFSPYLLLILPMLGRLYLALRTLLLHSRMFNDAGSRSIGAMNKVSFNLQFVLKTLMTLCPAKALLIFITTIWVIFSWTLRACELEQGENHLTLLNSAWLISVTFLSIGYGDIVPHTSCGRLIAVATGTYGKLFYELLKLGCDWQVESRIRVKHCAANVLRETWLLYKHAKLMPTFNSRRVRAHQRKFLQAIYRLRTMKVRQRELQDKSNSLVDLAKLQTNVYERVADISLRQEDFQNQLTSIEDMLRSIQMTLLQRNLINTGSYDNR
ncbi:hypothetical protein MN116_008774 [Schistosoma mekongi]|uniref:Calmodulin-binding domain-containing protein n=1 Tax=Schistosoma mekongi TaxID=38744 RepID=A0AAE1Z5P1_SCHME|nr:hypothetical protein MN116_008774 [Schistosoma mekongi]